MGEGRVARVVGQFRDIADVWLAVRIGAWAIVLPALKHLVPVRTLAASMHRPSVTSTRDRAREARIVTFARWAARITRPRAGGNCLERGLIAYRYLSAVGARPTLVVGIGRTDPGHVTGHAWVLVDDEPAGETAEAVGGYTPVFAFGPDGAFIGAPDPPPAPQRS